MKFTRFYRTAFYRKHTGDCFWHSANNQIFYGPLVNILHESFIFPVNIFQTWNEVGLVAVNYRLTFMHKLLKLKIQDKIRIRSSLPEEFCEKDVLKNFAKFPGKHLSQSLFFDKVASATSNFFKKETPAHVFPSEFCENFKNTFF